MFKKILVGLCLSSFLCYSSTALAAEQSYLVKKGDSLWIISQNYGTSIEELKRVNRLTTDNLSIGQKLLLSSPTITSRNAIVRSSNAWLFPQNIIPQNVSQPTGTSEVSTVELVDWFINGKSLFKSGEIFAVTDCDTGQQLNLKVLSAGNHCDIEPATAQDTKVMLELFGQWTWSPRPVIIHKNGKNIAGSLSGMPHNIDTTPDNGVNGHFDLYLQNSKPHGSGVSERYVQQHLSTVAKAAGN